MVYALATRVSGAMRRVDLEHLLYILQFMDKIEIVKYEMSQCESWKGQGYFWPRH